jgi:hypothetical protein
MTWAKLLKIITKVIQCVCLGLGNLIMFNYAIEFIHENHTDGNFWAVLVGLYILFLIDVYAVRYIFRDDPLKRMNTMIYSINF